MTPQSQPNKTDFNHITVNFRWVLPIMMGGYIVAWSVQQNWQNQKFDNLQKGQESTWAEIKQIDTKIDSVQEKEVADFEYVLQHAQLKTSIN